MSELQSNTPEVHDKLKRSVRTWSRLMVGSAVAFFVVLLVGIMSTVFGMAQSFETLSQEGGGDPGKLAESISASLISTAWGVVLGTLLFAVFLISLCRFLILKKRLSE